VGADHILRAAIVSEAVIKKGLGGLVRAIAPPDALANEACCLVVTALRLAVPAALGSPVWSCIQVAERTNDTPLTALSMGFAKFAVTTPYAMDETSSPIGEVRGISGRIERLR
jgi:hypothetical protein